MTPDGMVAIEDICVGDEVISTCIDSFEVGVKRVAKTFVRESSWLVHIKVAKDVIHTTPEHLFYVKDVGFVEARLLRKDDRLACSSGDFGVILEVEIELCEKAVVVYNFEVEEYHTYHVGDVGVWVHNADYSDKIKWGIHTIEVEAEGAGFWGKRIQQNNSRVDAYELKVNPNNKSYYLPHPKGGFVQFENFINSTVQDCKLIIKKKSFYHVDDMPDFAKIKVLNEANRQIDAAKLASYNVEWIISDKKAVSQLINLFNKEKINIKVKYYPE